VFKKLLKRIKNFLTPLEAEDIKPRVSDSWINKTLSAMTYAVLPYNPDPEEQHREHMESIAIAELEQSKDALKKNLKAQHRIMIATLILAVVAVISTLSAIIIAISTNHH
jgi:hypothetical protein